MARASIEPDALPRWMAAVATITRALSAEQPLPAVLDEVAHQTCALIGFDYCAVMLADADGERLTVEGSDALSRSYVRHLNSDLPVLVHPPDIASDTPAARAFREARTVTLPDVRRSPQLQPWRQLIMRQGYRAILAAPLCRQGSPVGVLVGYTASPRTFTDDEIGLVNLMVDHAVVALHNAALRAEERRMIGELAEANAALATQQDRARWVERQDRKLMRLLVADVGIDGVIRSLAESLDAAVVLEDGTGRVLAGHGVTVDREAAPVRAALRTVRDTLQVASVGGDQPVWIAPIVLSGELVALLWVGRADGDRARSAIIERFSLMVALELVKERHATATELRLSRDLLTDLLDPVRTVPDQALRERAAALGHDLTAPHRLVLLTAGPPVPAALFERAAGMVRRACPGPVLAGVRGDELVLLVPADADVAATVERLGMTAVLGDTVPALDRYPGAYRVARAAADLGAQGRVVDVAELGVWALLLENGTPVALRELADRLLAPIEDHDSAKGTALAETLRTWLRHSCATATAAEDLVVHPNTVTYRLGRIEALTGRSLKDHDSLLQFHIALTIRELSRTAPSSPGSAPRTRSSSTSR